jgi:RNA polymerase sigma-70 factor (ECF subfamily)
MREGEVSETIQAVWRAESGRIIASLTRMVRDVGRAEELAQDALVSALERWPEAGVPDNPGAWLMSAAKNRAIDLMRRDRRVEQKHDELGKTLELTRPDEAASIEEQIDDDVGDDLLRLIFTACHPVLPAEARVALTLRLLGGLSTEEIARAFVLPEPTIAQRIVRAKRTLAEAQVAFEVPRGDDREARLSSVLEVVYLIFNEGYAATAGDQWMRPGLCDDALRLGRVLSTLSEEEPEVHGLLALMEIQASRMPARTDQNGEPVLLLEQDRARWDSAMIARGLASLARAEELRGAGGPYALQAAIAACHARARRAEDTDWTRIAVLYFALGQRTPSPIVELNRAVAVSMAFGPASALPIVAALHGDGALSAYSPLWTVHGDLLAKLQRFAEARTMFERAAELTRNAKEQQLALARAAACARGEAPER